MADVGILNLQIHHDSSQAEAGLQKLADALFRIRRAVKDGLQLSGVASQIRHIAKAVNENVSDSTISRIARLGDAMARLKGFGNVNVNLNATGSLESTLDSIERSRSAMSQMDSDSERMDSNLRGASEELVEKLREGMSELELLTEKVSILRGELDEGIDKNTFDDKRVVNYAMQIMRLEERMERLQGITDQIEHNEERGFSNIAETFSTVEAMQMKYTSIYNKLREGIEKGTMDDEKIATTVLRLQNMADKISSLKNEANNNSAFRVMDEDAVKAADGFLNLHDQSDRLRMRIEALKQVMGRGILSGEMDETRIAKYADQIENLELKLAKLTATTQDAKEITDDMQNVLSNVQTDEAKLYSDIAESMQDVGGMTEEALKAAEEYEAEFEIILEKRSEAAELAEEIRKQQEAQFYTEKEPVSLDKTNAMADNITKLDLLKAQLREAETTYNNFVNTIGADAAKTVKAGLHVSDLRDKIWEFEQEAEESVSEVQELAAETGTLGTIASKVKSVIDGVKSGLHKFGDSIKKLSPTISGLVKRFGQIAKYRMLRYVLKQITEGLSEGIKNVYGYSKAIGGGFASSMDDAATSLLLMKNSLGAAAAPLIQSVIPLLQTAVSWFIEIVNWANQFISLLSGQTTWTRAVPKVASAFDDQKKAAKGAAAAVKDLLADWDELNIIQSETSGSGLGTSTTAAEDYLNMFEQVYEFDKKAKDIVGFIDDHFGGILELAKQIGVLILGWKISNAFEGVLGRLGEGIKGSALVYIGVELAYGSAYDAGVKGYFDSDEILGTLGGIMADAIGGAYLGKALRGPSGAVVGFGIGLMVGVVASIIGWVKGQEEHKEAVKWGNLSRTREETETFVKNQFTFDVEALLNILDASITNERAARSHLNGMINDFTRSFETLKKKISIGIDVESEEGSQALNDAYESAKAAIAAVQGMITSNHNGLEVLLNNFRFVDSEGKELNEELLGSLTVAETTLEGYFTGLGEEMARWMYKGQQSGWENGELEQLLKLMESQKRIYEKAEEYSNQLETERRIKTSVQASVKDGIIDYDAAKEQMKVQQEILNDVEEKTRAQAEELYSNYNHLAGLALAAAEEAGLDTEVGRNLKASADTFISKAEEIINNIDGAVKDKLAETKATMAKEWAETMSVVYGGDYSSIANKVTAEGAALYNLNAGDFIWNALGNSYSFNKENYAKNGALETAKRMREELEGNIRATDYSGIATYYMDTLGGNLYDLISEDLRQSIFDNLVSVTEDIDAASEIFRLMFDIGSIRDVEKYAQKYYDAAAEAASKAAQEEVEKVRDQIRQAVKEAMSDGVMTDSEALQIMMDYHSDVEYSYVMEEFGYQAVESFKEGMEDAIDSIEEDEVNIWDLTGRLAGFDPRKASASAGLSDVTPRSYSGMGEEVALAPSSQEQKENTEVGVRNGTADLATALNQLVTLVQSINRKDFTVKFPASSAAGFWSRNSEMLVNNVTGD